MPRSLGKGWFPAVAAALLMAPGIAQAGDGAAAGWRTLAHADLEAAYDLVAGSHPGAVEVIGDEAFSGRLERAKDMADERLERVGSYAGYAAVLNEFASALGDEHIWTNQKPGVLQYRWAGLVMGRQGSDWVVAVPDASAPSLKGAVLRDCDAVPADEFAASRLAFHVSRPIQAQLASKAPFLLIDDGNPFASLPGRCSFTTAEGVTTVDLEWRDVSRRDLVAALGKAPGPGSAGFGVRRTGDVWWFGIERFSGDAGKVVDEVEAQREQWRGAPAIVVDLRGNGGGDSAYGARLARLIYGDAAVDQAPAGQDACAKLWRASGGNIEAMKATAKDSQARRELIAALEAAIAAGQPFDEPVPHCPPRTGPQAASPAVPLYVGTVILLTDRACFSSCLLTTRLFRSLGAVHAGEETNAATRYMEVREIDLPSGLSTFSTLQAVLIGGDSDIGPFAPAHVYNGDPGDQGALDAWIARLAAASR